MPMPTETSRNVNMYDASTMRFSTPGARGTDQSGRVTFLPKLFGAEAEGFSPTGFTWSLR